MIYQILILKRCCQQCLKWSDYKIQHAKALSRHSTISCFRSTGKVAFVRLKRLTCVHVQLHSFIHSDQPLVDIYRLRRSPLVLGATGQITRRYMLKSLCAITSTVYPHSICLLPNATKVGANVVFTSRLLPLTTSLLPFYAPTVP